MPLSPTNIFTEKPDIKTYTGFEKAYNLYSGNMFAICLNQIKDAEVAKELVQDIFRSLWERKDTIELQGPLENYLYRAAKMKVIDHFRAEEQKRKYTECSLTDLCQADQCTENQVLFNELSERISLLVDSLPCQCRNVYKLSREKGLTNKEIASSLLISERAVEFHITKALSVLRKNLAADLY